MKMSKTLIIVALLCCLGIYLFVTAPPPLMTTQASDEKIPIQIALQIVNNEHSRIRKLYTKDIVGEGLKRGLQFKEEWEDEDVIAGPLPAQFLREIARTLEQDPVPLGLYLASDFAINKSNLLEGEQLRQFIEMKISRKPIFIFAGDIRRYVYMVPDIAVAKPCVKCHNEHKDSPKNDWHEGDIMGATTWTYPRQMVSYQELFNMLIALNHGVSKAYSQLLEEFNKLDNPPVVGKLWPSDGYALPDLSTFLDKIDELNAMTTLKTIVSLTRENSNQMLATNE